MTDFTSNWDWPQWVWVVLMFLSLLLAAGEHGKPHGPYNFPMSFLSVCVSVFILIAGGFFV